ncbi:hypothetical protein [Shimia sp.]|uniref:hypothetical protein n=1 Tax=Shimia sp. TaxID=1954381 RepID=UPI003BAC0AE8
MAFDTGYDWLKALVLMLVSFGIGNLTGWLKPEPREIEAPLNYIGDYIEGYTFYTAAFDAYVDDYGTSVSLIYQPPELETVRYCEAATFSGRKRELFQQILQKTTGCIAIDSTISDSQKTLVVTPSSGLQTATSDKKSGFFCKCEQVVLDRFLSDPEAP